MKHLAKFLAILIAMTILTTAGFAETAEPDKQVVATVNGTPLYLSELNEAYSYYTNQGYSVTYAQILDILVETQVLKDIIAEGGFNQFTDEEKAAQQAEAAQSWENAIQNYVTNYASEDTEEAKAALRVQAEQYFRSMGYSPEYLVEGIADQEAQKRYLATLASPDSLTREEVQAYLETIVAAEKQQIGDRADMYEMYQMYTGQDFMFTPEGYRRVLHILMRLDSQVMTAYQEAVEALEAMNPANEEEPAEETEEVEEPAQAEEAAETETKEEPAADIEPEIDPAEDLKAALDSMLIEGNEAMKAAYDKAVAKLEQFKADASAELYASLKEAVDAIAIASLQKTIDEIEARLGSGEEFAAVAKEYNEDPGEDFNEGYKVHPESIMWDPVFRDAAFSAEMAKPGDHSKPVLGSNGVHILYYLADVPAGAPELTEALYAELAEAVLAEKQYTAAEAAIQAKAAVSEIVKNTELINELESKADDVDISFDDMPEDEAEEEETPDAEGEGN